MKIKICKPRGWCASWVKEMDMYDGLAVDSSAFVWDFVHEDYIGPGSWCYVPEWLQVVGEENLEKPAMSENVLNDIVKVLRDHGVIS